MSSPVNPRRSYDSARRREQARRTRLAVIDGARRLFLERGFAATTMPAVASEAAVSVQTVYKVFGTKARLAKAVFDVSMAGDDEPETMLERPALARVRDESEPRADVPALRRVPCRRRPRATFPSSWSSVTPPAAIPRRAPSGTSSRRSGFMACRCSPGHCTNVATCVPASRRRRLVTCCGRTTRRRCSSCSSFNGVGRPGATGGGSPTR